MNAPSPVIEPAVALHRLSRSEALARLDSCEDPTVWKRLRFLSRDTLSADIGAAADRYRLILAEADGLVVGMTLLLLTDQPEPVVWLDGISVDLAWRHRGIGGRLLREAADWGRSMGRPLSISGYTFFGRQFLPRRVSALRNEGYVILDSAGDGCSPLAIDRREAKVMGFHHHALRQADELAVTGSKACGLL